MGNAAIDLVKAGFKVSGSDQDVYSPMKEFLVEGGISPMTPYAPENLEGKDLLIVGNAISRGNPELEEALRLGIRYVSLPEFLRWGLLVGRKNLVVTGTHGKTTSTALLSHILLSAGLSIGYMIGGMPLNLQSGFSSSPGDYFAIEGDEYDIAYFDKRPKFLQYLPFAVIINNIQFDHGDIYRNLEEIQDGFRKLMRLIPENGLLIVNGDDPNIEPVIGEARCEVITFGMSESNLFTGSIKNGRITVQRGGILWGDFSFAPPGQHNMMNALGVTALVDSLNLDRDSILRGLSGFRGVKRRLELIGDYSGVRIYDDFAHHPSAVRASIDAVRENNPQGRLWAIFQPRSNTSVTNVFQKDWVKAFSQADCAVIADLHRRDSIPVDKRLSRERLQADLGEKGVRTFLWNKTDEIALNIMDELEEGDILLIMSNSDFEGLPHKIRDGLI